MKMIGVLCALALFNVFVSGHQFLGLEEPGGAAAANGDAASEKDKDNPPLEGPAHNDNLQDEIVDQADPEFDMTSGGDDCISWEDRMNSHPAFEDPEAVAQYFNSLPDAEKQEKEKIHAGMLKNLKMQFEHADSDSDGCVNKAEFKAAKEMEGPPPGYEANKLEDMSEEELREETIKEDRLGFDAMDDNKDGKISQTEAYDFAANEMPAADVNSDDLDEMFTAADTDKDGFITFEEFEGAGEQIEGDGNEMKNAKPMPTSPPPAKPIKFKAFMLKRKIANERVKVTMKMLAHKPPLKFMSSLLN